MGIGYWLTEKYIYDRQTGTLCDRNVYVIDFYIQYELIFF